MSRAATTTHARARALALARARAHAHALALGLGASLAGCDPDPCATIEGSCIALDISSPTIPEIDQLEVDLLYGTFHSTTTTTVDGGGTLALPVVLGIAIDTGDAPLDVGIVAAGKLGGNTLGTGAASTLLDANERASLSIVLVPPVDCVAASFYCGGDKVAGDPNTLYQCNGGGVPLARGRCLHGCVIAPGDDDYCDGGPERCNEGGLYCGGNELDGDPQTLYRCVNGVADEPRVCANACVIQPPGTADTCR